MNKYLIFVFLLISTFSISQNSLSDYSYVVVPKQFSFISEPDKYQINSLTKYLFNQNGFNAYFLNELPTVNRCDGLYADVEGNAGLAFTKVQIILKDCNDNEVYRSDIGKSKLKLYSTTFQDALRKAFNSIERLNVQQKEIKQDQVALPTQEKVVVEKKDEKNIETKNAFFLPTERYTGYVLNEENFLLQKMGDKYVLFQESSTSSNGLLKIGELMVEEENLIFILGPKKQSASFQENGTLVIEDSNGVKAIYKPLR